MASSVVLDDLIWVCCKIFFFFLVGCVILECVCWDFAMFVLGLDSC